MTSTDDERADVVRALRAVFPDRIREIEAAALDGQPHIVDRNGVQLDAQMVLNYLRPALNAALGPARAAKHLARIEKRLASRWRARSIVLPHVDNAFSHLAVVPNSPAIVCRNGQSAELRSLFESKASTVETVYHVDNGRGPIVVSPDGQHILFAGGAGWSHPSWIFATKNPLTKIEVPTGGNATTALASPDGAWWALAGASSDVSFYDWQGKHWMRLSIPRDSRATDFSVLAMVLSPDGKTLVTADDGGDHESTFSGGTTWSGIPTLRAWALSGTRIRSLWKLEGERAHALAISPDGATLLAGNTLRELASGQTLRRLDVPGRTVRAEVLPDGRWLTHAKLNSFDSSDRLLLFDPHGNLESNLLDGLPSGIAHIDTFAIRSDGRPVTAGGSHLLLWTDWKTNL